MCSNYPSALAPLNPLLTDSRELSPAALSEADASGSPFRYDMQRTPDILPTFPAAGRDGRLDAGDSAGRGSCRLSDSFNPYHEWLGFSSDSHPPDHYELLGISSGETDPERIATAFQQRYAQVRKYQVGKRSAEAISILQELTTAYEQLSRPRHESWDKADQAYREHRDSKETSAADRKERRRKRRVWHVRRLDGIQRGPISKSRLRRYVERGKVDATCLVWRKGWTTSLAAGDAFPELFGVTLPGHALDELPAVELLESTPTPPAESNTPVVALLVCAAVVVFAVGLWIIWHTVSSSAAARRASEASQPTPKAVESTPPTAETVSATKSRPRRSREAVPSHRNSTATERLLELLELLEKARAEHLPREDSSAIKVDNADQTQAR